MWVGPSHGLIYIIASLWFNSTTPPPCPECILHVYTSLHCVGVGRMGSGPHTGTPAAKSLYRSTFFWWRHFALPSTVWFLSFYGLSHHDLLRLSADCCRVSETVVVNIGGALARKLCPEMKTTSYRSSSWKSHFCQLHKSLEGINKIKMKLLLCKHLYLFVGLYSQLVAWALSQLITSSSC